MITVSYTVLALTVYVAVAIYVFRSFQRNALNCGVVACGVLAALFWPVMPLYVVAVLAYRATKRSKGNA